jgi:hypothetical protein
MKSRQSRSSLRAPLTVIAAVMAAAVCLTAQAPARTKTKTQSVPHTSWGDPDLQGVWTNLNETPLQRVSEEDKAAAIAEEIRRYGKVGHDRPDADTYHDKGVQSPLRPSLIVDPADGRLPIVAGKRVREDLEAMNDSYLNHGAAQRCITKGVPGVMFSSDYGSVYVIAQSPGYVVILPEMIHDARIIPVDGRPHVSAGVRLWNGDPRGHWEGATLVVETTNFNNKGDVKGGVRQTETLRVVERFTRLDAKTIDYRATFEDPAFTRPWTVAFPLNLDSSYQMLEYACHEGNGEYMQNTLKAGRFRDAEQKKKTQER